MNLKLLSVALGKKLRTSHCSSWDFVSFNAALPLSVLIDSIVSLMKIYKSFPKFFWCYKTLYCRVAGRTTTAGDDNRPINLLSSLIITSEFYRSYFHWAFIFSTFSGGRLMSYSVNLLILLETPKLMSDPILTFERWLKNPSSEAEISTYLEQLVVPPEKLLSTDDHLDIYIINRWSSRYITILMRSFRSKVLELSLIWRKLLALKKVRSIDIKVRLTDLSIGTWHISWSFLTIGQQNMRLLNQSWT